VGLSRRPRQALAFRRPDAGVRIITANGDDLTDTSDPSRVMMRQIAGAFAHYEKARLVARLGRAREVKGKLGGRKSLAETRPEVVELARRLRHTRSGKQRSLREISAELAQRGFVAKKGRHSTHGHLGDPTVQVEGARHRRQLLLHLH
jgi:DNA invertase Pin-like site-specific DNA recombinase